MTLAGQCRVYGGYPLIFQSALRITTSTSSDARQGVHTLLNGLLKKKKSMNKEYTHFFRNNYTTAWDKLVDWKISNRPKIENKLHTIVSPFFFSFFEVSRNKRPKKQTHKILELVTNGSSSRIEVVVPKKTTRALAKVDSHQMKAQYTSYHHTHCVCP